MSSMGEAIIFESEDPETNSHMTCWLGMLEGKPVRLHIQVGPDDVEDGGRSYAVREYFDWHDVLDLFDMCLAVFKQPTYTELTEQVEQLKQTLRTELTNPKIPLKIRKDFATTMGIPPEKVEK